ncbi:MAG: protein tyrosine phosphatase family protein, partial [Myxococcota bacterium]
FRRPPGYWPRVSSPMMSTLRSTFGYLATLITRYTPFDLSRDSLEGIFNFLRIRDSILTSGQPTETQFRLVRDAGVNRVINLAPHSAENALADEGATLHALGMDYVHIPVDFRRPTEEDFEKFCEAMGQLGNEPVLVHCAANMRVSAFIFRYRRDVLGEDPETILRDLHAIWQPFGVWKRFVER